MATPNTMPYIYAPFHGWFEVQDASTDPLVPVAQTTEAQVQNVAAAVDAVPWWWNRGVWVGEWYF